MRLLTTLYNETHLQRADEFVACLQSNAANPAIDGIHVFYDNTADNGASRLREAVLRVGGTIHEIAGRPTYADLFSYANQRFDGQIVILANADIRFNETLRPLNSLDWTESFLAITRHDFVGTRSEGSSDVWMFRAPIPVLGQSVTFGTIYCDQVISFLARKQGLRVDNPCLSVECEHLHQTGVRNRPGTSEHRIDQSSSSDGLEGQTASELERRLIQNHGLRLMAFSAFGGGMIWPSELVTGAHAASPKWGVYCRKVPRWQPVRTSIRQARRAVKRQIRRAISTATGKPGTSRNRVSPT